MAPVVEVTPEVLVDRRDAILRMLGLTDYAEFTDRAALGLLTDAEWTELDKLEAIAFLLGDDAREHTVA